jgi:hypothetical protein
VPRHWHNFFDDMTNELAQVTNKVYEGGVSKGSQNGNGQMVYPNGDVYKG